jgi:hypothetical protein
MRVKFPVTDQQFARWNFPEADLWIERRIIARRRVNRTAPPMMSANIVAVPYTWRTCYQADISAEDTE